MKSFSQYYNIMYITQSTSTDLSLLISEKHDIGIESSPRPPVTTQGRNLLTS